MHQIPQILQIKYNSAIDDKLGTTMDNPVNLCDT